MATRTAQNHRYLRLQVPESPGLISTDTLADLRALLSRLPTDDAALAAWFGRYISAARGEPEARPLAPQDAVSVAEVQARLDVRPRSALPRSRAPFCLSLSLFRLLASLLCTSLSLSPSLVCSSLYLSSSILLPLSLSSYLSLSLSLSLYPSTSLFLPRSLLLSSRPVSLSNPGLHVQAGDALCRNESSRIFFAEVPLATPATVADPPVATAAVTVSDKQPPKNLAADPAEDARTSEQSSSAAQSEAADASTCEQSSGGSASAESLVVLFVDGEQHPEAYAAGSAAAAVARAVANRTLLQRSEVCSYGDPTTGRVWQTTPEQCLGMRPRTAPETIRLLGGLGDLPIFCGCQTVPVLRYLRTTTTQPLGPVLAVTNTHDLRQTTHDLRQTTHGLWQTTHGL